MKREFDSMTSPPEIREIEDQLMAGNVPAAPPAKTETEAPPPAPASEPASEVPQR